MAEFTLEQLAARLEAMDRRHEERIVAVEQELVVAKMRLRQTEKGLADILRMQAGLHESIANVHQDVARTKLALPDLVKSEVVFERLRERAEQSRERR